MCGSLGGGAQRPGREPNANSTRRSEPCPGGRVSGEWDSNLRWAWEGPHGPALAPAGLRFLPNPRLGARPAAAFGTVPLAQAMDLVDLGRDLRRRLSF